MITFKDWMVTKESSAFTRAKERAAQGIGHDIPDASYHSRSTAEPWMIEKKSKRRKKKKSKK
jgi:hypothetical protein